MPAFALSIPHTLGKETAKSKLSSFVTRLKEKYPDQAAEASSEWAGDDLRFAMASMGIKVQGIVTVTEDQVSVKGDLPITAMMFKGTIVDSLRQSLERALAYEKRD
ncbi:MAG: polyhydroxyalkanoic acid system family protein [Pirellulales bacterium]